MELRFSRGQELGREQRTMSPDLYNTIHLLFARISAAHLFVPIRSMQYLAAIDSEEIVFVDGQGPRAIEVSWCEFRAGAREDLRAPVAYTCIYYHEKGREIMTRLHSEFLKALQLMEERQPRTRAATITPIRKQ
jgi:hypothetical protein